LVRFSGVHVDQEGARVRAAVGVGDRGAFEDETRRARYGLAMVLFERFVEARLRHALAGTLDVTGQKTRYLDAAGRVAIRSDVAFLSAGHVVYALDANRLRSRPPWRYVWVFCWSGILGTDSETRR
jgi:hypothetical protein